MKYDIEKPKVRKGREIQLTDALKTLGDHEAIYAYNFEGKRYDVGDKLGFLKATVDFALKKDCLKDDFIEFLKTKVETEKPGMKFEVIEEVAITIE